MDILFVLLTTPFWFPLGLVTAILVRIFLGSPVLFRQPRPGKNEKIFTLLKFRTMRDLKNPDGSPAPDELRLNRFGRLLRSTSLDEIPSLWNVLKGELSLVGPRPLMVRYLERYPAAVRRRHEVPPGLTGWAQIHGRNDQSWEERFERDLWYVENRSLGLDLRILFHTLWLVIKREGTGRPMPEYKGPGIPD